MAKINVFFALFIVLFSISVFAYDLEPYLTYTTGNAGIDRLGSFSNTYLTSPYQNQIVLNTSSNVSIFTMPDSIYTILTDDINGDSLPEFIVTTASSINVYTTECDLISSLNFNSQSAPMLTNFNDNLKNELVLSNTTGLYFYEYNSSITNYGLIKSILYYNNMSSYPTEVYCTRYESSENERFCILINSVSSNITKMSLGNWDTPSNFNTQSATFITRQFNLTDITISPFVFSNQSSTYKQRVPSGNLQIANLNKYYFGINVMDNTKHGSGDYAYTYIFDSDLNLVLNKKSATTFVVNAPNSYLYFFKFGNVWFITTYIGFIEVIGNYRLETNIYDFSGNTLVSNTNTQPTNPNACVTPMMYAPLFKSGESFPFCIFSTGNGTMTIRAWGGSAFTSVQDYPIVNITGDVTGLSCVAGDFNSSQLGLGLACNNGYYGAYSSWLTGYPDVGSIILFNKSVTKLSSSYLSTPTIAQDFISYNPYVAFSNGVVSYIYSYDNGLNTCGNNVCENTENVYSCPVDCNITTPPVLSYCGDGICYGNEANIYDVLSYCAADCINTVIPGATCCVSDIQCTSPTYNTCFLGSCVRGFQNVTCYSDTNCPINSPICIGLQSSGYGKCINALATGDVCNSTVVFLGSPTVTDPTTPTGNAQEDIYNTWQILFGANTWLRYFIGLIILISTLWGAHSTMPNSSPVIVGIIGLVMMIFLTMIGLLPIWLSIIVGILVFFLFYTTLSRPAGG